MMRCAKQEHIDKKTPADTFSLKVPARVIRKTAQYIGKEAMKLLQFADNTRIYLKIPMGQILKPTREFNQYVQIQAQHII